MKNLKFLSMAVIALTMIFVVSCSKDDESTQSSTIHEPEVGTVSVNLSNILTAKSTLGAKGEGWMSRTTADEAEYPYCTDADVTVEWDGGSSLTYIAELFDNGQSIGHRMSVQSDLTLTNVHIVNDQGQSIYDFGTLTANTRNFIVVQNPTNGMSVVSDQNAFGTASISGETKEVCDLAQPVCDFSSNLPEVNLPTTFTVEFWKNGQVEYSFENVTEGTNSYDIVLDTYDVVVKSTGWYGGNVADTPDLDGGALGVNFQTTPTVSVTVGTRYSLVLIDKQNIDPTTVELLMLGTTPAQVFDFGDYVGAYIKGVYDVDANIVDTQGNAVSHTIEPLEEGVIYRILVCPDAEVGISVAQNLFTDVTDIVVD